jgi:hypothetical protein
MYKLGVHRMAFREIVYWGFPLRFVEKVKRLKAVRNIRRFTGKRVFVISG